jgi:hypothetical protein
MAKSKKNIPAMPSAPESISMQVDKNTHMRVDKIENGYLITKSGMKGRGRNAEYFEKRHYTPRNPIPTILSKGGAKFGGKK